MQPNMDNDDQIYVDIYNNLTKLRKQMPKTIYSNSDRLVQLLELIIDIKHILDSYTIKTIIELEPVDRNKLLELQKRAMIINGQLKKNNYEQFKAIEYYMSEFADTIRFIFMLQDASTKVENIIEKDKKVNTNDRLEDLKKQLEKITKELLIKKAEIKKIGNELKAIELKFKLSENKIIKFNDEIKLAERNDKQQSIDTLKNRIDNENKILNEEKNKLIEKNNEYDKLENQINELTTTRIRLTISISEISGGKKR